MQNIICTNVSFQVTEEDLAVGRLYPPLSDIRNISVKIATKLAEEAYEDGTAATYPEPKDGGLHPF